MTVSDVAAAVTVPCQPSSWIHRCGRRQQEQCPNTLMITDPIRGRAAKPTPRRKL